jgi:anti-sigma B factor antagonist
MSPGLRHDDTPEFSVQSTTVTMDVVVVRVEGQADLYSAPALRDELIRAVDSGASTVVVDLGGVTFIDSMTLGVLLGAAKRLRPSGSQMRVVVDDPHIRRVFELTLLDQVFLLFKELDAALATA